MKLKLTLLLAIGLSSGLYAGPVNLSFNPRAETSKRTAEGFAMPRVPDGAYGVLGHGLRFTIKTSQGMPMTAKEVAVWIRRDPCYREGMPVYLLCCYTGSGRKCLAQDLANELKASVHAPDELLWVYKDGSYLVAKSKLWEHDADLRRMGRMIEFQPRNS